MEKCDSSNNSRGFSDILHYLLCLPGMCSLLRLPKILWQVEKEELYSHLPKGLSPSKTLFLITSVIQ